MTPESVGPLSRPVSVERLPAESQAVTIEATAEERAALARDFKLAAIRSLTGTYRLSGTPRRVHVSGRVAADITQTCVVTLEPFDSTVTEDVEVDFVAADPRAAAAGAAPDEVETDLDRPDEIANGRIDLGSLTAEFLALGLDPYPRKPGVEFAFEPARDEADSPFAALSRPKGGG